MMTAKSVLTDSIQLGYDNNWNNLNKRVTHSQSKSKEDYAILHSSRTKLNNNQTEFEIKNTVWNSINKKDVITQNIQHQCKKFDLNTIKNHVEKIPPQGEPQTANKDDHHGKALPSTTILTCSIPRPTLCPTKSKSPSENPNQIGDPVLDNVGLQNVHEKEDPETSKKGHSTTTSPAKNQKMDMASHFQPENMMIEIVSNGVQANTDKRNAKNNQLSENGTSTETTNNNNINNKLSSNSKPSSALTKCQSCYRCEETVYTKELLEPRKGVIFHEWCLRCEECGLKLTLKTFVGNQKDPSDPRVYCKNHAPQLQAGKMDHTAKFISSYQHVPKVPTFNGQIRGPDAGKGAKFDTSALSIQMALNAPRTTKKPSHTVPPPNVVKSDTVGLRYF